MTNQEEQSMNEVRPLRESDSRLNEEWVEINQFPTYFISNKGRVRHNKRILRPFLHKKGYPQVFLYNKEGVKHISVHRLVASHFIPNPFKKPQVNHKDKNKLNNNAENLEWVTNQENSDHRYNKNVVYYDNARKFQLNWKAPICTDPNYICNKKMEVSHELY